MPSRTQGDCHNPEAYREVARVAEEHLRHNPYTAGKTISCECERGVLVLHGRVASYYQKQHAQAAVLRLEGVAEVVNKIEVGP
jgi:osmotically-inducible protein OsmY